MPESRHEGSNKRRLASALILLGVALLGGAGYRDRDMLRLETVGARVQGTVVAVEARSTPKGGTVYRPVVRFTPANGSGATQFEDGDGTNPPSYHVGDAVQVLYVGGPAATAVIDRGVWNWRRTFIVSCAGVLCLALGFSMLRRLSPRDDWLMPPTEMSAPPETPAVSVPPAMSVPPTMSAPPATANLVAATHVIAAPAVAPGATTVPEPWLTRLHHKRWVVALFVVNASLMFALTANKTGPTSYTGYTAFGAILFTLVCALAMFSAFTAAVAHVLFIVFGVTGAIKEGAAGEFKPHPLTRLYSRLQGALWKTGMVMLAASIAMLGSGLATQMINAWMGVPTQPAVALTGVNAPTTGALDYSPLNAGKLTVWFGGSQDISARQQAILSDLRRDFPNLHIDDRTVSPSSFVADWLAASGDAMPDVAFVDNVAMLRPLSDKDAVWQDWGFQNRYQLNGWWVIAKRSPHVEAARAFLRWLPASPQWRPMRVQHDRLPAADVKTIESIASAAFSALRSGDRRAFELLLDPDAARARDDPTYSGVDVISAKPLQTFGNAHLAFSILQVVANSDRFYGVRDMLFIFRKRGDDWRILHLERDTNLDGGLLHWFDGFVTGDGSLPPVPVLVEPADNAQISLAVARYPQLSWNVASGTATSFLIEWQMNVEDPQAPPPLDVRDLAESSLVFSRLFSVSKLSPDQLNYRVRAPFRVNAQPYRIRIWALDPSGQTSFSEWHAVYFTDAPPAGPAETVSTAR
jgi:hypothetical protein